MIAVFKFNGVEHKIEVPLWLFHISQLTELAAELSPADLTTLDESREEEIQHEAYLFLVDECCKIFAENQNVDYESIVAEFHKPTHEDHYEFGAIINIEIVEL